MYPASFSTNYCYLQPKVRQGGEERTQTSEKVSSFNFLPFCFQKQFKELALIFKALKWPGAWVAKGQVPSILSNLPAKIFPTSPALCAPAYRCMVGGNQRQGFPSTGTSPLECPSNLRLAWHLPCF